MGNCITYSNEMDDDQMDEYLFKKFGINPHDTYVYPRNWDCCWRGPSDGPEPFTDTVEEPNPRPNDLTRDVCDYDGTNYDEFDNIQLPLILKR